MNTVKIEKGSTRLIAHRGLSGIERENTNAAFVAAGNRSYYGIETDIYRTSDGHFAINHDNSLLRVSGEDILVESSTLEELRAITLNSRDNTKLRRDLKVSTLEEYLSICKNYEKQSILELKSDFTEEEIERIIEIIKSFDYLDRVSFISFKYSNLLKIRRFLPTHSVQFLFSTVTDEILEKLRRDKIDVDVNYKSLTPELIDSLHEAGLLVNCWTVDNPEVAARLIDLGIDFITTDILE